MVCGDEEACEAAVVCGDGEAYEDEEACEDGEACAGGRGYVVVDGMEYAIGMNSIWWKLSLWVGNADAMVNRNDMESVFLLASRRSA